MSIEAVAWFRDKQFTADWTSMHIAGWETALSNLRDNDLRVLEVGSWEGRSAVFWLEYLRRSHVTCVDTFAGSAYVQSADGVEARFDSNMSSYGGRVRKIKNRSAIALATLAASGATFDLIYIDGSHARDDVLVDSLLCWPMLLEGGHIIWDDYHFGSDDRPLTARAQQAIDLFFEMHGNELSIVHINAQVIARRIRREQPDHPGIVHSRTPWNLWRFLSRKPMLSARGYSTTNPPSKQGRR